MRYIVPLALGGVLLVTTTSALASYISPLPPVSQPRVLMVDGKDRDSQVGLDIRVRTNSAYLDFVFISNGSFTSLANNCCLKTSTSFTGGVMIDFAVRSQGMDSQFGTADDQIFRLSDPAHYADQYYSGRIKPWKSRNPEVLETYYSSLTLMLRKYGKAAIFNA